MKQYLHDQDGAISVEFLITFPLLMLWLVFSFIFFDAYRSNSQTEKVAYTMSDIMSRHDAVDATDIAFVFGLQDKMLPPRLDQRASRITSICFEDGVYKVLWSISDTDPGVEGMAPLTDETIPLDIMPAMAAQDSVILTEVRARWTPITSYGGLPPRQWVNALVSRPRFVQIIPHETLNTSTICPVTVGGSSGT